MMLAAAPSRTKQELLCGALELGLRMTHRESDRLADLHGCTTLFAVDVDVLTAYANPHDNAHYVVLTGLLDRTESRESSGRTVHRGTPTMVGLAEMLGRYLFREGPEMGPKLLLEPLETEFFDVLGAIERHYLAEMQRTAANLDTERARLQKVVDEYLRSPEVGPVQFVARLAERLEVALPVLYGRYSAAREIHRLGELLRVEDGRLLFAGNCTEVAEALGRLESGVDSSASAGFDTIHAAWRQAIEFTSPRPREAGPRSEGDAPGRATAQGRDLAHRQKKRDSDARAMAQVEWLNRHFAHQGIPLRICFLTGAGRLCSAALRRFNAVAEHRLPAPRVGSQESRNFGRYLALASPVDGLPSLDDPDQALHMGWAPIRDLRSFVVDDAFVDFAGATQDSPEASLGDGLARWLPVFFSQGTSLPGGRHQDLADSYLSLHELKRARAAPFEAESLPDEAYAELQARFDAYLRFVGAAHAVERGLRHRVVADIGKIFAGADPARLLGDRLRLEMSRLVMHVSSTMIRRVEASSAKLLRDDRIPVRGVPPLILTRYRGIEQVILEVLSHLRERKCPIDELLRSIEVQVGENARDQAPHVRLYLWLLCKALIFAVYGDWRAAYALATQAFTVSQLQLFMSESDEADGRGTPEVRITGREALYLCHVAARRQAQDAQWWRFEGSKWQTLWATALAKEHSFLVEADRPRLVEFHQLRLKSERLALRLTLMLSAAADRGLAALVDERDPAEPAFEDEIDELVDHLRAKRMLAMREEEDASGSVLASHWYVVRQCLVNRLQFTLLSLPSGRMLPHGVRAVVLKYSEALESNLYAMPPALADLLCPSLLDLLVLACAKSMTGTFEPSGAAEVVFPEAVMPYDVWRFGHYRRQMGLVEPVPEEGAV